MKPLNHWAKETPRFIHYFKAALAATVLLAVLATPPLATAQSDNFDDGNDTSPPFTWQKYNPILQGSYLYPNNNSYRLRSDGSLDPVFYGPARVGSLCPTPYTNFYVSVDIIDWDDSIHQVAGVMARMSNLGAGTTDGYLFSHDRGNPFSSTAGDMDIVRLDNEVPTSLPTVGADGIHFEPGKSYRLVFIGVGTNFTGYVYELPNAVNPVVTITASDSTYASGPTGILVANNESTYAGPADATFDNFVADLPPKTADYFNDGNDTTPAPAWVRYNPIKDATGLPSYGTWSFPSGGYRLQTPPSPDKGAVGPARLGSLHPDNLTNFYISADIVNWDDSLHQVVGLLARVQSPGPGMTSGYMFVHDRGDPASPTSGDMDIVRLTGEMGTTLPNTSGTDSLHFQPGKQYRLVFTGAGNNFTGMVYELPNLSVPVVSITATDTSGTPYEIGASGLVAVDNPEVATNQGTDVTFDNFMSLNAEPKLTYSYSGSTLTITWPQVPLVLESSSSIIGTPWTPVAGINVVDEKNIYTTPVSSTSRFYRLGAQ